MVDSKGMFGMCLCANIECGQSAANMILARMSERKGIGIWI